MSGAQRGGQSAVLAAQEELEARYPKTVAAFRAMDALESLHAVANLDQQWQAVEQGHGRGSPHGMVEALGAVEQTFDLIYAGGGLGLLHAAVMARRYGYRVLVFDRGTVGCAHREWNVGADGLEALVQSGLFTDAELEQVVMRRYRDGVVRFFADGSGVEAAELHLPGVLDIGLDAEGLLQCGRQALEQAGGTILDQHAFERVWAHATRGVAVEVRDSAGTLHRYGARLLVDGMGASSPLAFQRYAGQPFAGICPTVGTVVRGLERGSGPQQHDPEVGDILISVDHAQRGRQLIWEGFAGRDDDLTVYVFYYDLVAPRRRPISAQRHSLLELFEDYFALFATYKRPGPTFRHVRPVYGFIPARHTERQTTTLPLRGVLPIGDASAQQSPLTFCGFGSHVRNLQRTTGLLQVALEQDLIDPEMLQFISAYQANVALNWVFSRFMQPWRSRVDVNRLQNVFARVLNELGPDVAVRFFKDQMRWGDYGRIVNHTLAVYRAIIPTTLEVLGARQTIQWIADYLRFSRSAALATVGRATGPRRWHSFVRTLELWQPRWAFRMRAAWAEWEAMGWAPPAD
ncbi:MAG: hypothetical protein NVS2B7_01980 [Herpetosiphon sp.]